jgi:hypothetical protein
MQKKFNAKDMPNRHRLRIHKCTTYGYNPFTRVQLENRGQFFEPSCVDREQVRYAGKTIPQAFTQQVAGEEDMCSPRKDHRLP